MAALPEPWKSLRAALERLSERVKRIENTSPFSGTGLSIPETGTTQVEGNLWITGDLTADGKISNDALTEPVVPGIGRDDASGYALTTTAVEKCGTNLTVPSGCTSLLAVVSARLYMVNSNTTGGADGTGTDAIYVLSKLGTQSSVATPTGISGSNGFATTTSTESYVLTGLTPGSTVRLAAYGASGYASLPTQAGAYVSVCAALTWLR